MTTTRIRAGSEKFLSAGQTSQEVGQGVNTYTLEIPRYKHTMVQLSLGNTSQHHSLDNCRFLFSHWFPAFLHDCTIFEGKVTRTRLVDWPCRSICLRVKDITVTIDCELANDVKTNVKKSLNKFVYSKFWIEIYILVATKIVSGVVWIMDCSAELDLRVWQDRSSSS